MKKLTSKSAMEVGYQLAAAVVGGIASQAIPKYAGLAMTATVAYGVLSGNKYAVTAGAGMAAGVARQAAATTTPADQSMNGIQDVKDLATGFVKALVNGTAGMIPVVGNSLQLDGTDAMYFPESEMVNGLSGNVPLIG